MGRNSHLAPASRPTPRSNSKWRPKAAPASAKNCGSRSCPARNRTAAGDAGPRIRPGEPSGRAIEHEGAGPEVIPVLRSTRHAAALDAAQSPPFPLPSPLRAATASSEDDSLLGAMLLAFHRESPCPSRAVRPSYHMAQVLGSRPIPLYASRLNFPETSRATHITSLWCLSPLRSLACGTVVAGCAKRATKCQIPDRIPPPIRCGRKAGCEEELTGTGKQPTPGTKSQLLRER